VTQPHKPWLSRGRLGVLGMGTATPGPWLSTATLIDIMQTRFGFSRARQAHVIADRLGITGRHCCRVFKARHETPEDHQGNPDLAAAAVRAALSEAGLQIGDIAYLIGHTTTPAQPLPSNIAMVADRLGYGGPHVELRQACTGFANALMIASGLVAAGSGPVAIVGSETGSLFFDPASLDEHPGQIVNLLQMGDGAGAIIVGAAEGAAATIDAAWFGAIGLDRAPGISRSHGALYFDHDFALIRQSGHALFEAGRVVAATQGHPIETAQHIIPHQASGRIGAQVATHFALPEARVFVNADRIGNTGSAAIWMALAALRSHGLGKGEKVVVLGAEASKFMYGGLAYTHG
jgi:3-oxoacyl-[acyl-carrier-protein] synthase III